jgi:STE24 endopeptidase
MEAVVIGVFLVLFTLELVTELALNDLNLRHVREQYAGRQVPDFLRERLTDDDYRRSVEYTLAKGRFQRVALIYGACLALFILFGGVLPYLDDLSRSLAGAFPQWLRAHAIIFCLALGLIFSLLGLPLDLYETFVIEERFGFNKTTPALYAADKLKGLVLGILIGVPFLWAIFWLMEEAGGAWWIWAFLFVLGFELLMVIVYPTLIAPLFNKFEPLEEGEWRRRIQELADQTGFKTGGIYTMDGSRRSGHSNAYFTGLGKAKRIVLFDTLMKQMSLDQGLAVLAHEIGHYRMKHIRRRMVLQALFLLVGFYVLSLLLEYEPFFRAFGLERSNHAALVLFALVSGTFTFYITPWLNRLSRKHEYEADRFSAETLKDGKPMEEALVNLTIQNLSNLTPHPWYSAYHYSHPTAAERISAIRNLEPYDASREDAKGAKQKV